MQNTPHPCVMHIIVLKIYDYNMSTVTPPHLSDVHSTACMNMCTGALDCMRLEVVLEIGASYSVAHMPAHNLTILQAIILLDFTSGP